MHLMIDIETMSTHESRALILSVAAVPFSLLPAGPEIGAASSWVLDPREQLALSRYVDRGTQDWWASQSEQARGSWVEGTTTSLREFAPAFTSVCAATEAVWANGITFDLCNLVQLLDDIGAGRPWSYNAARDFRTVRCLLPKTRQFQPAGEKLVAHDAVSDCIKQIRDLWERWVFPPEEPRTVSES